MQFLLFLGIKMEFRREKFDLNNEKHYEDMINLLLEYETHEEQKLDIEDKVSDTS